jgi:CheY-like chemotaxis protein
MTVRRDETPRRKATGDSPIRVVCVDDEPDLAATVSGALEHVDGGISATGTDEPTAALRGVREGRFDCVVSDYEMPGHDGAWLCDRVSQVDRTVPFVLYTARAESRVPVDGDPKLDGVTAVVRKGQGMSHYATLAERVRRAVAVEREW